jgi:GTP-binding protein HflX
LQGANLLVIGNILKPHQMFHLNEQLKTIWAVAWDRVDLILKIFEKNAKTEETKLQIELAAIKHMWPRIFNMWMELWRQGWKWSWETNTETMKRHLWNREKEIRKKLEWYSKVREIHRQARKKKWFLTVGIVGYTNAGKSTLLNSLTNKWVLSEDKLFATLSTSVWKMWIAPKNISEDSYAAGKEILLSDTIWFIRDLPPELIDAFASTLEDSIESDILFHVVDASDPKIQEKIQVVDNILQSIWAKQDIVYIFNKVDKLSWYELIELKKRYRDKQPLYISTYKNKWLEQIYKKLSSK